jgi:hypothetical protein
MVLDYSSPGVQIPPYFLTVKEGSRGQISMVPVNFFLEKSFFSRDDRTPFANPAPDGGLMAHCDAPA